MDVKAVEKLLKAGLGVKIKLKVTPPLYVGSKYSPPFYGEYSGEPLHWNQMLPEKYRCGLKLWQHVKVTQGPDAGREGFVAAWEPYPDYTLVMIQERVGRWHVRMGYRPEQLAAA